jgi:hypothetical protein
VTRPADVTFRILAAPSGRRRFIWIHDFLRHGWLCGTRLGAYVASAWLILVALNLALAGYFDVAVRNVVMAIGAFTLARLTEVRMEVPLVNSQRSIPPPSRLPSEARFGETSPELVTRT